MEYNYAFAQEKSDVILNLAKSVGIDEVAYFEVKNPEFDISLVITPEDKTSALDVAHLENMLEKALNISVVCYSTHVIMEDEKDLVIPLSF